MLKSVTAVVPSLAANIDPSATVNALFVWSPSGILNNQIVWPWLPTTSMVVMPTEFLNGVREKTNRADVYMGDFLERGAFLLIHTEGGLFNWSRIIDGVVFRDFEVEGCGGGGLRKVAEDAVDAVHWGAWVEAKDADGDETHLLEAIGRHIVGSKVSSVRFKLPVCPK